MRDLVDKVYVCWLRILGLGFEGLWVASSAGRRTLSAHVDTHDTPPKP